MRKLTLTPGLHFQKCLTMKHLGMPICITKWYHTFYGLFTCFEYDSKLFAIYEIINQPNRNSQWCPIVSPNAQKKILPSTDTLLDPINLHYQILSHILRTLCLLRLLYQAIYKLWNNHLNIHNFLLVPHFISEFSSRKPTLYRSFAWPNYDSKQGPNKFSQWSVNPYTNNFSHQVSFNFTIFNQVWSLVIFHNQHLDLIQVTLWYYFNHSSHLRSPYTFKD